MVLSVFTRICITASYPAAAPPPPQCRALRRDAPARKIPSPDSSARTAPQADDAYLGGALLPGVPRILVVSAGYAAGGTTRATLAAEPRRPKVLAAKVPVFTAVSLATAEVTTLASILLGQALLTSPASAPRCPAAVPSGPSPVRPGLVCDRALRPRHRNCCARTRGQPERAAAYAALAIAGTSMPCADSGTIRHPPPGHHRLAAPAHDRHQPPALIVIDLTHPHTLSHRSPPRTRKRDLLLRHWIGCIPVGLAVAAMQMHDSLPGDRSGISRPWFLM
jgi:hypothetical protein